MIEPREGDLYLDAQTRADKRDNLIPDLPAPENKRFYPALDGLRAFAVLLVFFHHYHSPNDPSLSWGWAGVDIFFVLSGFLITGILYDTRNTPHRFRNFYARRTLRIFPLYYAVLLFGVLLTPVFHWLWNPAWVLWFFYLGNYARFIYLHSPLFPKGALEHLVAQTPHFGMSMLYLGHFWSLCVEEQFYLVWPLVVFYVRDRVRLRNLCLVVCCLALLARVLCVFVLPQPYLTAEFLYRVTPLRADALLIGGLAALCLRGPEAETLLRYAKPVVVLFSISFVVWQILYFLFSGTHHLVHPAGNEPVMATIGFTLIDLFAAALLLSIVQPAGVLFKVFNLRWARQLGQISYGFYVFHDMFHSVWAAIAYHFLREVGWGQAGTAWLGLVGTIAISSLSFRYFESPFLRLKRHFTV